MNSKSPFSARMRIVIWTTNLQTPLLCSRDKVIVWAMDTDLGIVEGESQVYTCYILTDPCMRYVLEKETIFLANGFQH